MVVNQCINGHGIAVQTEATDDTKTGWTQERMVAEILSFEHIADVNLNNRARNRTDTIVQSNARVGVGAGVQHDAISVEAHRLHLIDELTLYITLEIMQLNIGKLRLKFRQESLKRAAAIDAGLACSQ